MIEWLLCRYVIKLILRFLSLYIFIMLVIVIDVLNISLYFLNVFFNVLDLCVCDLYLIYEFKGCWRVLYGDLK